MSQGELKIVNGALVQLGEDPVQDIDADPAPSRLLKIRPHLQPAIDAVLVKYGWLCALEYHSLEPSAHVPDNWKFPFHYVLPKGALRLWEVERADGWERGRWKRDDGATQSVLRAKQGGRINLSCVMRRDADGLDANVVDAVTFELAARACRSMNGSTERALELRKIADLAVASAMGSDGQDAKGDEAMVADRVGDIRRQAQ